MTVDVAPQAPPSPPAPPTDSGAGFERVHTGLFWGALAAILVGALVIGASRVWTSKAADMVTFPLFDQTTAMHGDLTYHLDPTSLAPLQAPDVVSFDDSRRIQTPGLLGNRALLVSTDTVTLGGNKKASYSAQYLVDIRTLANLASRQAWSYSGSDVADRSAAYSVNLPFDTGAGPYQVWLNEVDRAYAFTQVGQPFDVDGLTVVRLRGHLDRTAVDPAYIAQMSRAGVPAGVTLHQLQPALAAMGLPVDASFPAIPAALTGENVAALTDPIPLDYSAAADTSLLVEPRTGTIVAVEQMDESFSARLDPARLGALTSVLAAQRSTPGVSTTLDAVSKLGAAPEAALFDLHYAQTRDSVTALSGWAKAQRDWVNRMTRVIPATLLAAGIALAGLGAVAAVVAWRRRHTVYVDWWDDE